MNRRTFCGYLGGMAAMLTAPALAKTPTALPRIYFGDSNSRVGVTDESKIVKFYDLGADPYNVWGLNGLCQDKQGRLLVSDTTHQRIYRLNDFPRPAAISYSFPANRTEMSPLKIAVDPKGRIVILDLDLKLYRLDDMNGANLATLDLASFKGPQAFIEPRALRLDSQGRIYVSDFSGLFVARFDDIKSKKYTRLKLDFAPQGLAVDSLNRVYVSDPSTRGILRYDDMSGKGAVRSSGKLTLKEPGWLALDMRNRIYVSDSNERIVRMDDVGETNLKVFPINLPVGCAVSDIFVA